MKQKTALNELIEFYEGLRKDTKISSFEFLKKVIEKANGLIEKEKQIIEAAFDKGYDAGYNDNGMFGEDYFYQNFEGQ